MLFSNKARQIQPKLLRDNWYYFYWFILGGPWGYIDAGVEEPSGGVLITGEGRNIEKVPFGPLKAKGKISDNASSSASDMVGRMSVGGGHSEVANITQV